MRAIRRQSRVEEVEISSHSKKLQEKKSSNTRTKDKSPNLKTAQKRPSTQKTNKEKTAIDQSTIGEQLGSNKPVISQQLASDKPAIGQQLASKEDFNKPAISQQLASNKPVIFSGRAANKPADKPADTPAISQQLASKTAQNQGIHDLIGKEAKLTDIIFFNCQNRGALETSNLTTEFLKNELKISSRRLRNLIERLAKKCVVEVSFSKRGNGGLRRFKLSPENYHKIATSAKQQKTNKPAISQQLASIEGVHKPADKPARPSSSSSYIDIKETTTTQTNKKNQLNSVIIPESLATAGMTENHLSQVWAKYPHAIPNLQRSLEALAYDIDWAKGIETFKQQNKINNLFGWFFGAIKAGGYESKNDGFLTDEERGEIETLERLKKQKEKREARKQELEELMFDEWLTSKTKKEIESIKPPVGEYMGLFHRSELKAYFVENEMTSFQKTFQ